MAVATLGLPKHLRQIGYYNYCVSFIFAMIFNALLIFAVAKRSTKMLQSYRKVFVFHIAIDVCLSSISVLTMCQPISGKMHDDTPIFFHIVAGLISSPPQPWTTILATIAIFFGVYNVTTAPVTFIYRHLIICHNHELTILPFILLCLAAGIGPLAYSLTVLIRELQTQDLEESVKYLFVNTDWIGLDGEPPAFGVMYTSRTSINSYITPITVVISYSIVIYCTIGISIKMWSLKSLQKTQQPKQNSSMIGGNNKNRRSQRQLQTVLFFQAIVPFLTSGVSTLAIQVGRIFGLSQPWWFYYLNLLNTWSPVANPLVALIVIAPYRKFVLHPFNSKSETSSTNNNNAVAVAFRKHQHQQQQQQESTLPSNKVNIIKVIS